ncbi:MAG: peptidoglycan-binding protein [Granulosicoccus sp.]
MTLTSPNFRNVPQLEAASGNSPWLKKGVRGHGVHLIQFALIDLGFPMPQSIGGAGLSPDGIYGDETVQRMKEFQRSSFGGPPIKDDGAAGSNTMSKLDRAVSSFTHRVRVHMFINVTPEAPVLKAENLAKELYGRYGIDLQIVSSQSLPLSHEEEQEFSQHALPFRRMKELAQAYTTIQPLPTEIMVFYILLFDPDTDLALSLANRTGAVTRIKKNADVSTLAHEIAHNLIDSPHGVSEHVAHKHNILAVLPRSTPFVLSIEQVEQMRKNIRLLPA